MQDLLLREILRVQNENNQILKAILTLLYSKENPEYITRMDTKDLSMNILANIIADLIIRQ